jgi:diguanylate cyclase (GGDEF)-like protein/PAS domain S-box-containing protein
MTARVMAAWMFAVVLAAEYVTMLLLDGVHHALLYGQIEALIDAAVVGLISTVAFVLLQAVDAGKRVLLQRQTWINASVVLLTVGGFETALHPLSENITGLWGGLDMDVFNAVLLAIVISLVTAWVIHVERLVSSPKPDESRPTLSRAVMAGALICALCLTSVLGLREINSGIDTKAAALGLEVNSAMARLKGHVLQVGRQSLIEAEMLSGAQGYRSALNVAVAQEVHSRALLEAYYRDNYMQHGKSHRLPDLATLGGSWVRFLSAARAVKASRLEVLLPSAIQLQYVIDEYRVQSDRLVEAVAGIERERKKHRGSDLGDGITAVLGFLMAMSILQPILRLTGAQVTRLGKSLVEVERANSNLESYQRAIDEHAIFAVTNAMGKILQVNDQFLNVSKYTREEVIGQAHRILHSGVHKPAFYEELWRTISNRGIWRGEFCNRASDGSFYWVDSCITPLVGENGKIERYVSIAYDITARKQAELAIERKTRLESVIEAMRTELLLQGSLYGMLPALLSELNLITGATSSLVVELGRNREGHAWGLMLGHSRGLVTNDDTLPLTQPEVENVDEMHALVREAVQQHEIFGGQGARQLGSMRFRAYPINVGYEPVGVLLMAGTPGAQDHEAYLNYVISALADLMSARRESDRRRADQENQRRLAKRDPLTGLGNRRDLMEEFESRTDHPDAQFALMLIDLDRFKPINDTLGHLVGDTVLRVVSERLNAVAKGDCSVARIGGDEFAILTEPHVAVDEQATLELARKVLEELRRPISCEGHDLAVGASVGVALYPRDGRAFQEVLHCADAAMYRAKVTRCEAQVFDSSIDDGMRYRAELETDLKKALDDGSIVPHFQPYVDLNTGVVVGHEVLARWKHPTRGWVSPGEFVKIAEEAGLVERLFWQMLRGACTQHVAGHHETILSVNLSPAQINNPLFAQQLVEELERLNFPPHLLEVEITETSMVGDQDRARPLLLLLKSFGIQIALDDFGTGYSSLALLRSLPISKLKIDRSFSSDLETQDAGRATLVNAIIGIAKAMSLKVTVEGIEQREVAEFLRRQGANFGQGYLYAKARPEISLELDHAPRASQLKRA